MKKITIEVKEDVNLYVSDVLCWLKGFLAAKQDLLGKSMLEDAIKEISLLNAELKDKL